MFRSLLSGFCLLMVTGCTTIGANTGTEPVEPLQWSIVIHGGAGVITRENMSAEREAAYLKSISESLDMGEELLGNGANALDVVEQVIRTLEDDPLYNAGRGAVLTETGAFSLDASIMDGDTLDAGAVAGLSTTQYPISAARAAMMNSPHVLLSGVDADAFAAAEGIEQVSQDFFYTDRRWRSLERVLRSRGAEIPTNPYGSFKSSLPPSAQDENTDLKVLKYGTVGVVVMDQTGRIAAGTSTGGTTGKRWGRIGDSPIIGAGTYAKTGVCGVSSTGTGEFFIRLAIAHAICQRMELTDETAPEALNAVIQDELTNLGGDGGVVMLEGTGRPHWEFNTEGMYRGYATSDGSRKIAIYGPDD